MHVITHDKIGPRNGLHTNGVVLHTHTQVPAHAQECSNVSLAYGLLQQCSNVEGGVTAMHTTFVYKGRQTGMLLFLTTTPRQVKSREWRAHI